MIYITCKRKLDFANFLNDCKQSGTAQAEWQNIWMGLLYSLLGFIVYVSFYIEIVLKSIEALIDKQCQIYGARKGEIIRNLNFIIDTSIL